MENTTILSNAQNKHLQDDHQELISFLNYQNYSIEKLPKTLNTLRYEGECFSGAYPIQGILKYHGMIDSNQRIAFFPSISINNDCAKTITYIKLDRNLKEDRFILNGKQLSQKDPTYFRISHQINNIRRISTCNTKAFLISRNCMYDSSSSKIQSGVKGKGLGTSASAGAAIAEALTNILYDRKEEFCNNSRLKSILSRYMAGSATRSVTGGISLWLNHPNMISDESFSLRLDNPLQDNLVDDVSLITIPLELDYKTDEAHKSAVKSPFFPSWALGRLKSVKELIQAIKNKNMDILGKLAEYDTLCLHSVTMTAPHSHHRILWKPQTIQIMQDVQNIRNEGTPVYYSIDTGPSVVLITSKNHNSQIIKQLKENSPELDYIKGKIGGSSHVLEKNSKESQILKEDINRFIK